MYPGSLLASVLSIFAVAPVVFGSVEVPPNQKSIDPGLTRESASSKDLSDVIAASPLLTLHRVICEVESITNDEHAVGKLFISYLEAHNFTVTTQKVPQQEDSSVKAQRYNIIALPRSSKRHPKVLLSSHIDTVPPYISYSLSSTSRSTLSTTLRRKDILISGRGTVDAKACVAAQTMAVQSLMESDPKIASQLGLVFVVGEERSGDGMRFFSDSSLHSDLAKSYTSVIFGEPTEGKLATGHKGVMLATLKAKGKAAHSGYPWLGRSANSMMIPALAKMDTLGDIPEDVGGLPNSEKYGNSTVNIGLIRGGVAANVVPEESYAEILMRLAGGTAEEVRKTVTTAVHNVNGDIDLSFSQGYGPVQLDAGVKGFEEMTVNYGTDVPNLDTRKGVKRYLYGPGSILVAHGDNEGLTVGDLEESVDGYKKLILHALRD